MRLAFLDDHDVLLDSISGWITREAPDFDVVLSSNNWGEFVHSPFFPGDLVVLDYQLREEITIESRVRTCRAAGAKVIVLSGVNTRETRERSLNAGASVFLSKDLPMAELMDAARAVLGIERVSLSPSARATGLSDTPASPLAVPKLSDGELAALRLYVTGVSVAAVATGMGVHYETAKTYIRRVREKYVKAGRIASKRNDLIRRAAEDGYLD
jgi:DNA-binding NarL/FixJ family response regulator